MNLIPNLYGGTWYGTIMGAILNQIFINIFILSLKQFNLGVLNNIELYVWALTFILISSKKTKFGCLYVKVIFRHRSTDVIGLFIFVHEVSVGLKRGT